MNFLPVLVTIFFAHMIMMISPGPNVLLVTQIAASQSRTAGLQVAFGIVTGALTWACLALFGLSIIFEQVVWLYFALKFLGGGYLVYLGIKSWRSANKPLIVTKNGVVKSKRSLYLLGLMTNLSNPKSLIFFGSFFAALIPATAPLGVKLGAVLVVGFNVIWWYVFLALAMSLGRVQRRYAAIKTWLDRVIGSLFIIIGLRLAFSGRAS